jgi:hypothetical protein
MINKVNNQIRNKELILLSVFIRNRVAVQLHSVCAMCVPQAKIHESVLSEIYWQSRICDKATYTGTM